MARRRIGGGGRKRRSASWTDWAFLLGVGVFLATAGFSRWPPQTETSFAVGDADGPISGRARIIDGDTIDIGGERIRLWGVDAPEARQQCTARGNPGRSARSALARAVGGRTVTCAVRDHDDYGRTVAQCSVAGVDLGAAMVSQGWAWDYRQYSGGRYRGAESGARRADLGVWALGCEPAWAWRHRQ
jgi:endonuclease YncB( thermonuclease family)